jgi:hypothetical protein
MKTFAFCNHMFAPQVVAYLLMNDVKKKYDEEDVDVIKR